MPFSLMNFIAPRMVHQRKLEAARELYGLSPTDEVPEAMTIFLLGKMAIDGWEKEHLQAIKLWKMAIDG